MMNPWHDVSYGDKAPESVTAVIEIPKGSREKYELDKDTGMLILDRVLYSSVFYPHNYGFIPRTYCDDKDPLDILVISQAKIVPMALVRAKVIGVMSMLDNGEQDDKIIAVAANDMSVNHVKDITEISSHFVHEIKAFFEDYKKLENKTVLIEDFGDANTAKDIVERAIFDYKVCRKEGII